MFDLPSDLDCHGFPGPGSGRIHKVEINPMREFMYLDDSHIKDAFEQFKEDHNVSYQHDKEHTHRLHRFRHNYRFIKSHNRKGKSYVLKVNHLADRSDDEISYLRGRLPSKGKTNNGLFFDKKAYKKKDLPAQVDWRLNGGVTPVKDQAICGSCWSFGTTGSIEGALFVKTGKLVKLSEQNLIDCSWGFGDNGCDGGEEWRAYEWVMKHGGIATDESYGSYLGTVGIFSSHLIGCNFYMQLKKIVPVNHLESFLYCTRYFTLVTKCFFIDFRMVTVIIMILQSKSGRRLHHM